MNAGAAAIENTGRSNQKAKSLPKPMKNHLHLSTRALIVLFAMASGASAQQDKMPKELDAVRMEYFRRQDAAMQPVKLWYRQQVEQLEKSAIQRGDLEAALALRKEKESLAIGQPGAPALTIIKAMYGAGERTVDVTRQVQMAVINNKLHLKGPWAFSPDPAAGIHKEIKIQYRLGVNEKTVTFKAEEELTIP